MFKGRLVHLDPISPKIFDNYIKILFGLNVLTAGVVKDRTSCLKINSTGPKKYVDDV